MKIAICDDKQADIDYIRLLLTEWAAKKESLMISEFLSAEAFLFDYAEHKDHDILWLDIEMGGMDGVAMAKRIRKENESVQIVFITGYSEICRRDSQNTAISDQILGGKAKLHYGTRKRGLYRQENARCI